MESRVKRLPRERRGEREKEGGGGKTRQRVRGRARAGANVRGEKNRETVRTRKGGKKMRLV